MHTYIHIYRCMHIHVYIYIGICVCLYIGACIYTYRYTCVYVYVYVYIYMYKHICIDIHIYIHIYIYISSTGGKELNPCMSPCPRIEVPSGHKPDSPRLGGAHSKMHACIALHACMHACMHTVLNCFHAHAHVSLSATEWKSMWMIKEYIHG